MRTATRREEADIGSQKEQPTKSYDNHYTHIILGPIVQRQQE